MSDWTERLTEEERDWLNQDSPQGIRLRKAVHTIAALRALVEEKDKALDACKQLAIDRVRIADAAVKQDVFAADALMGIAKTAKDALTLTEAQMRKRLEEE